MRVELLAPAGDRDSFISAINAGANAVYLAGKDFGARKYASNFSKEEIKELTMYAHLSNVKVFVTVNTIIFENEIHSLFEYTDYLVKSNVDALIVQDIGMIEEFCNRYPDTEIHASTQMNAYNVEQVKYLKRIGVKRVILARETSINDIRRIKNEVDIDIETFVHGALCVSYSGNCLFSYFNGGRSGNRGECAQPCRLKYELMKDEDIVSDEAYLMSTKDLLTIDQLERIIDAGVVSLKIEGRMKKPSYVVSTVKAYREKLDNLHNSDFDINKRINELLLSFNREYTKGYILNEKPYDINNAYRPNHQGVEIGEVVSTSRGKVDIKLSSALMVKDGIRILGKKDYGGEVSRILLHGEKIEQGNRNDIVTIDILGDISIGSKMMKTLDYKQELISKDYLSENFNLVPLYGSIICEVGSPIKVKIGTSFISDVKVESEYIVQEASSKPQSKEQILSSFNKLGTTHYYLDDSFEVIVKGNCFVPNKVLKELRRNVVSELEKQVDNGSKRIHNPDSKTLFKVEQTRNINIKVENSSQYKTCISMGFRNIYPTSRSNVSTSNVYSDRIIRNYKSLSVYESVVIQDYGGIHLESNVIANYNMNIINSKSIHTLHKNNVKTVCLSLESSFQNTNAIMKNYRKDYSSSPNVEVLLYGRPDLMISKYCPITKSEGVHKMDCGLCEKNQYSLVNDKGQEFMLKRDYQCNIRVLSDKTVNRIEEFDKYNNIGVTNFRIEFTNESSDDVRRILTKIKKKVQL